MSTTRSSAPIAETTPRRRSALVVIAVCWLMIFFDGYDLTVLGVITPTLLEDSSMGLTAAQIGAIGSYTLIGALFGGLTAGTLADIIGGKKVLLIATSWFSVAIAAMTFADSYGSLAVLRFLSGIGLGGIVPVITAYTLEFAPRGRKQISYTAMATGSSFGALTCAILAIKLIPAFHWHGPLWVGSLAVVTVVPLCFFLLPESPTILRSRGFERRADEVCDAYDIPRPDASSPAVKINRGLRLSALKILFSRAYIRVTVGLWIGMFFVLLLAYGIIGWLPAIMSKAGYDLGEALMFTATLEAGAVIGILLGGWMADKIGLKRVVLASFTAAIVAALGLSLGPPLPLIYLLCLFAGFGASGLAKLFDSFIALGYPQNARATAVGWTLAFGRIGGMLGPVIGGIILGSSLSFSANFYFFALVGVLGFLTTLAIPLGRRGSSHEDEYPGAAVGKAAFQAT